MEILMIQNADKKIIEVIEEALSNIDAKYCDLSRIDYSQTSSNGYLETKKFLERPFAYEFYHQFRKLIDDGKIELGSSVIQGEVDKRYQHIMELEKIPDFIIHTPNCREKNLAVIEFKLASNNGEPLKNNF